MKPDYEADTQNPALGASAPNEIPFLERLLTKITAGLEKIIIPINTVTHKVSKLILFLMMLLTTGDVAGRYFLNKPITGTYELTGLGLALIIFFSLGITQLKKDHIAIDFAVKKFPEKVQHSLHAITYCALFILLLLTSWQLVEYTMRIWQGGDLTGDLGLPLFIFTILASIGTLFFALSILLDIFKSLLKVVQKHES